jgi:zinc protease
MNKFFLICLLGFLFNVAQAQQKKAAVVSGAEPAFVTSVEGVKEYRLANGLQILLVPDASQTNVVLNIVYHVGRLWRNRYGTFA